MLDSILKFLYYHPHNNQGTLLCLNPKTTFVLHSISSYMNSEKEGDYRAAIAVLLNNGYTLKGLKKVVNKMCNELADEREEARANHKMCNHHPYIPGVDGP